MNKKKKEIMLLLPHLIGKKVKINGCTEGTVKGWTGLYLLLSDITLWNGEKKSEKDICEKWISKIEVIE